MAEDALEVVKLRSDFYKDNYRKTMMALLLMIVINGASISLNYYLIQNRPSPEYFATTQSGSLIKLQPLSMPVVSASALLEWANRAAVAAYSYNFVDYRKQLQEASEFFTPSGWRNFEEALVSSRNLQTIRASKLVATAVATGAPRIEDQMVLFGRYTWRISIPILVKYDSANRSFSQSLNIKMIVQRVPTLNTPKGIAISQFIAAPSA